MISTIDMGQVHKHAVGVKHVLLDPNPSPHRDQSLK